MKGSLCTETLSRGMPDRNRTFMLRVVQRDGLALRVVGKTLWRDREFVMAAMAINVVAFKYADKALREDGGFL